MYSVTVVYTRIANKLNKLKVERSGVPFGSIPLCGKLKELDVI